jgi:hypothetical protein
VNIEPDGKHHIIPAAEITRDAPTRARYLRLTEDEARQLAPMTPEQRREWLKQRLPTHERLARHLEWRGAKHLADNARKGWYSEFNSFHPTPKLLLLTHLKKAALFDVAKHVLAGEYDDSKQEADAWAASQVGEVAKIIEEMRLK